MKKKTFLTTLSIAALAIVSGYGGIKAYQTQVDGLGLLTINDVEALADDSPEGDNNKYYLHHFSCSATATTEAEATVLAKFIKGKAKVGATADLTLLTQYFNNISTDGEGPCEKGVQKTCGEIVLELLGRKN